MDERTATFYSAHPDAYENTTTALSVVGALLVIVGAGVINAGFGPAFLYGALAAAVGLAVFGAGLWLSRPITVVGAVRTQLRGVEELEQGGHWTWLKVSTLLLTELVLFGAVPLVISILARADIVKIFLEFKPVFRLTTLMTMSIMAVAAIAMQLSMRTAYERAAVRHDRVLAAFVVAGVVVSLAGVAAAAGPIVYRGAALLVPADALFLVLAGTGLVAVGVYVGRQLPSPKALLTEQERYYRGRWFRSREKVFAMPALLALSILIALTIIFMLASTDVTSRLVEVRQDRQLATAFAIMWAILLVAMVATATFALSMYRAPSVTLIQKRRFQATTGPIVIGVSGFLAAVSLSIALLIFAGADVASLPKARWVDFFCLGLLVGLGPYGFWIASQYRATQQLEARFPDFLRDLAASRRAGLTLNRAVQIAAKGEYGALSPEIQKMADQLSWHVPFDEALLQLAERARTPLVERAVTLIIEASRSGGNVNDVLLAAARDAREIKNLENERRTTMALYTVVIYVTFFVFLGVAAALYGFFVPEIVGVEETLAASSGEAASFAGIEFGGVSEAQYRTFYFTAAIMQAIGNGLVAGIIASGRALNGMQHAFVMVLFTYVAFSLLGA